MHPALRLTSRRRAVATAAAALISTAAAVSLADPASAAPPSANRFFLPAYEGSATFVEYDDVEANVNSAVVSADHVTGDLALDVSASCSALLCDAVNSRTEGRAEIHVAYRAKREPVTMLVGLAFRDPVPTVTASGIQQRRAFAGIEFYSDGVLIGLCEKDIYTSRPEDSYFVECVVSDPDGGEQSITAYVGARIYDKFGDGITERLSVRAHLQAIGVRNL